MQTWSVNVFKGLKNRILDSTKSLKPLFNNELKPSERAQYGLILPFLMGSKNFRIPFPFTHFIGYYLINSIFTIKNTAFIHFMVIFST